MSFAYEQYNAAIDKARLERRPKLVKPPRKPGSLHPFKHADALYKRVEEAYVLNQGKDFELQHALAGLPVYTSHGRGGKHRTKNRLIGAKWSRDRSKYEPHQGKSECARRVFKLLSADQRRLALQIGKDLFEQDGLLITPDLNAGQL